MPDGHGYVNHFIPAEEVANYGTVLAGFGLGYTTQEMVEGTEGLVVANTLDELAEKCNLPVDGEGLYRALQRDVRRRPVTRLRQGRAACSPSANRPSTPIRSAARACSCSWAA
ncbi:MAG: hypothetical protein ACLUW6_00950 [Coriobacteriaceae bacterium]